MTITERSFIISVMRIKDENKKEAIFSATVRMINEIGFVNVSMSKIAKAAGVSTSTLYTYYENKEDMFRKVYMDVKMQMHSACNRGISKDETVKQSVRKICENLLEFMQEHKDYFFFIEQSSNSPLVTPIMHKEIEVQSQETIEVFERGIQEGILKRTSPILLIGFCFYPISQLYKESCQQGMLQDIDYYLVFQMCWDAIKN
ncbi:TetR/AcrR family transcriptional regulator [Niallia nealsonii]|uniref:TetR family transcriptional regulator n=1 Tax=Niallia nealsonii TaxID=115979 RepID=A0A2N0YZG7_9BACI|nr:TetR/AcrR family transcriptional regulator [Niallia nealsonii]PKG22644.1 TetR family transcriptional regulator [Niallia nealsonii]